MRLPSRSIRMSWLTRSKNFARSTSTTTRLPPCTAARAALTASCARLPGRNPWLCSLKVGSIRGCSTCSWQLHARLHLALAPPARVAPASDAWPLTSPCLRSLTLVRPFALLVLPHRPPTRATTTSADFSLRLRPSDFHPQGEISPGKNALLRCTAAGSTPPRLDHESFAVTCPLALRSSAFYPVLVHRLEASLHASSLHSVALMQLRFTSFAVINLRRDLHPQECARAGRTQEKNPAEAGFLVLRHPQVPRAALYLARVPTTSTSTRRFLARPSAVLLSAAGCFSPLPSV